MGKSIAGDIDGERSLELISLLAKPGGDELQRVRMIAMSPLQLFCGDGRPAIDSRFQLVTLFPVPWCGDRFGDFAAVDQVPNSATVKSGHCVDERISTSGTGKHFQFPFDILQRLQGFERACRKLVLKVFDGAIELTAYHLDRLTVETIEKALGGVDVGVVFGSRATRRAGASAGVDFVSQASGAKFEIKELELFCELKNGIF